MDNLASVGMVELNEDELMMVEGGGDYGKIVAVTLGVVGIAFAPYAGIAAGSYGVWAAATTGGAALIQSAGY
ncbi:hypothetical protein Halha_1948 [Halobacteroides halobius DSM 5150]|uniref:Class IIb bacteriocin, lactobin A/cerein 7B family n=1 Tax=Halobacteroides halobius (strain ATCC 35273 / DSM 5150 / MD-1) TaxID=748449 RepID=L0KA33_HALHC|nr:hypothetical protein [Halobacteroides halobius]AGB41856.1 hypothetical protein Halha_1948 [Halobacteroides halobius DSM 5150]